MGITDLFSSRKKKLPDVFVYDELPRPLRAQMVHILEAALGPSFLLSSMESGWHWIAKTVAHEAGILDIPETPTRFRRGDRDWFSDCLNYVLEAEPDHALDVVELGMRIVDRFLRNDPGHQQLHMRADDAIADLNDRFRMNGCGYQYAQGRIVRVDSQLIHADVVQPALALLAAQGFDGPNAEFLLAHEHFRHGRIESAVTEACKAFESTLKSICDARRWPYDKAKATAAPLIRTIIDHGLVPTYSQEQLEERR